MDWSKRLQTGLVAGIVAGLLWGIGMLMIVSPLIEEAESYEVQETPSATAGASGHTHHPHDHGGAWKRSGLTLAGTVLLGIAFGLIGALLVGLLERNGVRMETTLSGLLFGACGFLAAGGLQAIGLPPPPPGISGAEGDLYPRQGWWMLTAVCTVGAFLALAILSARFHRGGEDPSGLQRFLPFGIAALLLALPFWIGAPEHATASRAPEALQKKFLFASLGTSAFFWCVLGTGLVLLARRFRPRV